ncbi:tyrosine-type recombinase/integrase [Nocardioides sp. NPDC006303]|uniref:tyrosine-type recombinase/integrase n=1 Tax=Nocardioides sp. NPDC006303 TaxID=3156747 RepID=UPI0033B666E1
MTSTLPVRVDAMTYPLLTEDDTARIAAAISASHAETTRTAYACAWRAWERWCAGRGLDSLGGTGAEPNVVCAYLAERAADGASAATIDVACSAIRYHHHRYGLADPTQTAAVRQVRRGLHRILGTAPHRPARPVGPEEIRRLLAAIDRDTSAGYRDAAIILLGFAGALRRSELANLTLADLEPKPGGLLLRLRRSKTDPDARGQVVGIAPGRHRDTDPITALDAWLSHRGPGQGPVFTSFRNGAPPLQPISGNVVTSVVKRYAEAAGLTGRITAHSLRAGHATTAAMAGVGIDRIAAQARHRRIDILIDRYIRPARALRATSSRRLAVSA